MEREDINAISNLDTPLTPVIIKQLQEQPPMTYGTKEYALTAVLIYNQLPMFSGQFRVDWLLSLVEKNSGTGLDTLLVSCKVLMAVARYCQLVSEETSRVVGLLDLFRINFPALLRTQKANEDAILSKLAVDNAWYLISRGCHEIQDYIAWTVEYAISPQCTELQCYEDVVIGLVSLLLSTCKCHHNFDQILLLFDAAKVTACFQQALLDKPSPAAVHQMMLYNRERGLDNHAFRTYAEYMFSPEEQQILLNSIDVFN